MDQASVELRISKLESLPGVTSEATRVAAEAAEATRVPSVDPVIVASQPQLLLTSSITDLGIIESVLHGHQGPTII